MKVLRKKTSSEKATTTTTTKTTRKPKMFSRRFTNPKWILRAVRTNILHNRQLTDSSVGYKLKNKVAVVTASTDGIGLSIAKRLATSGASVIVSSRREENVERAIKQINELAPGSVAGTVCNVENRQDQRRLIEFAVEKFGALDILISNAGITTKIPAPLLDHDEDEWDSVMNVNLKSAFILTKEALPYLKKQKNASIVYVSSVTAYQPLWMFPSVGLYSVSKTALLGLSKTVAAQLGPLGIRANVVSPGMIHTQLTAKIPEELKAVYNRQVPLGRFGECREVAGLVAFLCSDDASYLTGESFVPSGGLYCRL